MLTAKNSKSAAKLQKMAEAAAMRINQQSPRANVQRVIVTKEGRLWNINYSVGSGCPFDGCVADDTLGTSVKNAIINLKIWEEQMIAFNK